MIKKYRHFALPILSGILLSLAYPPLESRFLPWLAFIPLLFFLYLKQTTGKSAFGGGYLAGFVFFAITTSWFLFASMADWVGPERKIIIILILALTWFFYILGAALFSGAAAFLFFRLKAGNWLDIFLFPALWAVFEYFKAWGIAIFTLGPGSLLGSHFTLGHFGYALAGTPFVVLAGIIGVYGLAFLAVLVNCLIFSVLQKNSPSGRAVCLMVIFLIIGSGYYFQNIQNRKDKDFEKRKAVPVTAIQTDFPSLFSYTSKQEEKFFETQLRLLEETAREENWPRIIIFPEHANFLRKATQFSSLAELVQILKQRDALIIDSGWHPNEKTGSAVTRLVYFDVRAAKIIAGFDKALLMPVGDYLPYFLTAILNLIGREEWIVNMEMTRGYEKGGNLGIVEYKGIKLGALMCSEIVSPYLYKELTAQGAEVLIGAASDAVFKGDRLLLGQLLAMAKVRAAENNRYFIQAANQGDSYVIDNRGKLVVKNEKIGNEVIHADVQPITGRTFYNRFGDWILILAGLIIGAAILAKAGFPFRR